MTTTAQKPPDADRLLAQAYAQVHRAYIEASDPVREVIDNMTRIASDETADPADRASAIDTLVEALFPTEHKGMLGVDIEDVKAIPCDGSDCQADQSAMAAQEASFAERLTSILERREITQAQLAEMIGVGQPAVSMMLQRSCRPQRRTIEKIAKALNVNASELWPTQR